VEESVTVKNQYSREAHEKVVNQLPIQITRAMHSCGWNVFGIYELVRDELKKERKGRKETQ
jgi:hypothetical protein